MKVELVCAQTDIQMDILDYLRTLPDNSIEAARAYHKLEHLKGKICA